MTEHASTVYLYLTLCAADFFILLPNLLQVPDFSLYRPLCTARPCALRDLVRCKTFHAADPFTLPTLSRCKAFYTADPFTLPDLDAPSLPPHAVDKTNLRGVQ